jgi:hypothetical protein
MSAQSLIVSANIRSLSHAGEFAHFLWLCATGELIAVVSIWHLLNIIVILQKILLTYSGYTSSNLV